MEPIRNFSLYVAGKKVGVARGHTYDIHGNNQLEVGDGDVVGIAQGVTTTALKSDLIVPVAGTRVSWFKEYLEAGKPVDIALGIVDGAIHKLTMYLMDISYVTETANGTLTGSMDFQGRKPDVQG